MCMGCASFLSSEIPISPDHQPCGIRISGQPLPCEGFVDKGH